MEQPVAKTIRIEQLRSQITRIEHGYPKEVVERLSSGCPPLDTLLPQGGLLRGTLLEWLAEGSGTGAATLAVLAAREATCNGRALAVIDRRGQFYPPAAARIGLDPRRVILIRVATQADQFWAVDQSLRCEGVGAVLVWPRRLNARTFRRWQLAAEEGGTLGLLLRPATARKEPSWAEIRVSVETLPTGVDARRRLRLHLLRCRGPSAGRTLDVEIDDETYSVYPASQLADPAPSRRAAGA